MNMKKQKLTCLIIVFCWLVFYQAASAQNSAQMTPVGVPSRSLSTEELKIQRAISNPDPQETARFLKSQEGISQQSELNQVGIGILRLRVEIDNATAQGTLSRDQIQSLQTRQATLEKRYAELLNNSSNQVPAASQKEANHLNNTSDKPADGTSQKNVSVSVQKELVMEDMITRDPAKLKNYQSGKVYLTVEQFKDFDMEVQQYVVNNKQNYIIVADASLIPAQTITRAELNSIPAEKRENVMNAVKQGHIKLID